eukprot:scaffold185_cov42-Attheya_sp.AAC.4
MTVSHNFSLLKLETETAGEGWSLYHIIQYAMPPFRCWLACLAKLLEHKLRAIQPRTIYSHALVHFYIRSIFLIPRETLWPKQEVVKAPAPDTQGCL